MAAVVSEMFTGVAEDGKVAKEIIQVGGLIELLHSASLIIDDI
jgi:geranylgeranyl pyrophosphate synthase